MVTWRSWKKAIVNRTVGCLNSAWIHGVSGSAGEASTSGQEFWGTILGPCLIFNVNVPGRSWNGSGLHSDLQIQRAGCQVWTGHPELGSLSYWTPEIFFINLPSVSADTWFMFSSFVLETAEFRDKLILGDPLWLSLAIAANFVCSWMSRYWTEKCGTIWQTESWFFSLFHLREQKSASSTKNWHKYDQQQKEQLTKIPLVLSFLLFIHLPWWETYMFSHQVSAQSSESTFLKDIQRRKSSDSGGKQTSFSRFLSSQAASFLSSDGESTSLIHRKWTSNCPFPRRHRKQY